MADRLVILNDGEIQQIGTPEELYAAPANAFVADLIGEANIPLLGGPSDTMVTQSIYVQLDTLGDFSGPAAQATVLLAIVLVLLFLLRHGVGAVGGRAADSGGGTGGSGGGGDQDPDLRARPCAHRHRPRQRDECGLVRKSLISAVLALAEGRHATPAPRPRA